MNETELCLASEQPQRSHFLLFSPARLSASRRRLFSLRLSAKPASSTLSPAAPRAHLLLPRSETPSRAKCAATASSAAAPQALSVSEAERRELSEQKSIAVAARNFKEAGRISASLKCALQQ
eukprot:6211844-Pleurochrysis_carterae.AAC.1